MALALALSGCGYHLANGSGETFTPTLGEVSTPHPTVAAALLDGARAELARHGALGAEGAALRVDLVRVEERAEGLVSGGAGAAAVSRGFAERPPISRAVRVTVIGRAHLDGAAGARRDTGDVEASDVTTTTTTTTNTTTNTTATATASGAVVSGQVASDAVAEASARRLGARLARKIMGLPEP